MEIAIGVLSVIVVTWACWLIRESAGYWTIALIYLTLVVALATRFHQVTILLIATVSAALWNFLFVPLVFSFRTVRFSDTLMVVMYYIVALVIGQLTSRLRSRELAERKHEQRTAALYRLAQGVVESTTLDEGLQRAVQELRSVFNAQVAVILTGENGQLNDSTHPASTWLMNNEDKKLASEVMRHKRSSDCFVDTPLDEKLIFLLLKTSKAEMGILGLCFHDGSTLAQDEHELLVAFSDQIAIMIERYQFIQQAGRTRLIEESEKLYKTILDCVSHELKTPIAVIQAATSEVGLILDRIKEAKGVGPILSEIDTASLRLSGIVDSLLRMTRIETGRYRLEPVWCDVDEIVGSARQQVREQLSAYRVSVSVPKNLPSVKVDPDFVEQALVNLLSNAAAYSRPGTEIKVVANTDEKYLILQVVDAGPGLAPEMAERIFDKFFRGPHAPPGGLGLGLSIVQGLVQALGGSISVMNNPEQGATFTMRVPVATKVIVEDK